MFSLSRGSFWVASLAVALAACTSTGSPTLASSPAGPTVSSATPSGPAAAGQSVPLLTGQTDTDWGRIWDSLPAGFPTYPGGSPSQGAETGPVSAVLSFQGVEAKTITDWMQSNLEQATYRTDGRSGPLENGGYVLDVAGSAPGCKAQVSVAPLGGLTMVTVRYGASCPAP